MSKIEFMDKGGAWFAISLFGTIAGGIFGSFIGAILMIASKGNAIVNYPRWGFYIFAVFGAHMALTMGMKKMAPDANSGTKLRVFGIFGAFVPALFLLACRAIQSSAN